MPAYCFSSGHITVKVMEISIAACRVIIQSQNTLFYRSALVYLVNYVVFVNFLTTVSIIASLILTVKIHTYADC